MAILADPGDELSRLALADLAEEQGVMDAANKLRSPGRWWALPPSQLHRRPLRKSKTPQGGPCWVLDRRVAGSLPQAVQFVIPNYQRPSCSISDCLRFADYTVDNKWFCDGCGHMIEIVGLPPAR